MGRPPLLLFVPPHTPYSAPPLLYLLSFKAPSLAPLFPFTHERTPPPPCTHACLIGITQTRDNVIFRAHSITEMSVPGVEYFYTAIGQGYLRPFQYRSMSLTLIAYLNLIAKVYCYRYQILFFLYFPFLCSFFIY